LEPGKRSVKSILKIVDENKTRLCPATGFYLNKSDWLGIVDFLVAKHKPATSGAFDKFFPVFSALYYAI